MRIHRLAVAMMLTGSILGVSASTFAFQRNGGGGNRGGGGGGQSHQTSPPVHNTPPPSHTPTGGGNHTVRQPPPQPVHAQREVVRTPNFVSRTNGGNNNHQGPPAKNPTVQNPGDRGDRRDRFPTTVTPRRPIVGKSPTIQGQRKFTKTPSGRVYDNGLVLRKGLKVSTSWQKHYFPKGHYHFPYYRTAFVRGQCYRSPFGFFFGVCVPYVAASECRVYPPAVVFVDIPVFNGDQCTGYEDAGDQNLFNDPNLEQEQPGLLNAIDNLKEAFQEGNIDGLVTLIDPNTSVAVYQNGHYQYSLSAGDYIDLSRDAIQSMRTTGYTLTYIHQRAPGVFAVGGKQVYLDENSQTQVTWVSYVLQDIGGQWTLTQVGTAPNKKRPR